MTHYRHSRCQKRSAEGSVRDGGSGGGGKKRPANAKLQACRHSASITVDASSKGPHAGQHFCVMCGVRLNAPVLEEAKPAGKTVVTIQSEQGGNGQQQQSAAQLHMHKPLDCRDVGITEYTTDRRLKAVGGVVKSRCTDFVVEEVRWDGSVVDIRTSKVDPGHGFSHAHYGDESSNCLLYTSPSPRDRG